MKIAVVGGGGREHAIIQKLKESPRCGELVAIPGNGGIAQDAQCVPLKPTDLAGIVDYCRDNRVDYVVVAPDDPLALGLVDRLAEADIPAFGPRAAAAQIEASKVFAKNLMAKYGIPTAQYQVFESSADALAALEVNRAWPLVVKADGLALGKGVLICQTEAEAKAAVADIMDKRVFGSAGARVVFEEFLTGPEVSVLAFCDGDTLLPMVSSMDHKRALDGDAGPNTGGMGAVAPNPCYTDEIAAQCMRDIFLPTLAALRAEGRPFQGCLYFGLMLTPAGPKVIEYNCRFGDPETQVVLPLLDSDLLEVMLACTEGRLEPDMVRSKPGAAACVVLASGGYPGPYNTGLPIAGLAEAEAMEQVHVYHAGTKLENGQILTSGGRVLGVTATGADLPEALRRAYAAVGAISFKGAHFRRDIGQKALP